MDGIFLSFGTIINERFSLVSAAFWQPGLFSFVTQLMRHVGQSGWEECKVRPVLLFSLRKVSEKRRQKDTSTFDCWDSLSCPTFQNVICGIQEHVNRPTRCSNTILRNEGTQQPHGQWYTPASLPNFYTIRLARFWKKLLNKVKGGLLIQLFYS